MTRYITTAEAARMLGVSGGRVRQLLLAGMLTGIKRGGVRGWEIDAASVKAYGRRVKGGR